jgi:hypothetical protein
VVSSTATPSGQYVTSSSTRTTAHIIRFTTRKTPTKPTKRRMVPMSVNARESSWPEAQRSWNETGSRCNRAYRAPRRSRSSWRLLLFIAQRRRKNNAASAMPKTSASATSGTRPARSPSASGPSTTAAMTSGTVIWAREASRAPVKVSAIRPR